MPEQLSTTPGRSSTSGRISSTPARIAFAAALFLVLGLRGPGCLFLDVLTGLYTGTFSEFSACKLDESGESCDAIQIAHEACVAEHSFSYPECELLWDQIFDCAFCDAFFAETYLASGSAAGPDAYANASAKSQSIPGEIYFVENGQQVFRTTGGATAVEEILDAGRWPLGLAVDPGAGKVYWTDGRARALLRADLGGSNVETLASGIYGSGVVIDVANQHVYFGNTSDGEINRLDVATLSVTTVATNVFHPVDLAFDSNTGELYWTEMAQGGGQIRSLDTTGPNTPQVVVTGLVLPFGLALDSSTDRLYWSDINDGRIRWVDLSSPGVINTLMSGLNTPGGVLVDSTSGQIYWVELGGPQLKRASIADPTNTTATINGYVAAADLALDATAGKLYWTGWLTGSLQRSNTDGTSLQTIAFANQVQGDLALDASRQKVYWALSTGTIQRANLDGSGVEDIVTGEFGVRALAYDIGGDKIYWTANGDIRRADADGANAETIVTGIVFIGDIEIDGNGGRVYWTNRYTIQSANLDGTGTQTFYTDPSLVEHLAIKDGILYWSVPQPNVIRRAAIDGSLPLEDVVSGVNFVQEIDIAGDKLYWSLPLERKIQRSNLDGSSVEDVLGSVDEAVAMVVEESSVLPVELVSFRGLSEADAVHLRWATISESGNAGFFVEHADQESPAAWQQLGFVPGSGTSLARVDYAFEATSLAPGPHRFRLRQMDLDGSYMISPTIEVRVASVEPAILTDAYPNPFSESTSFTVTVGREQHVRVVLYDALGRRVANLFDGAVTSGSPHRVTVSGLGLPTGRYIADVRGERFRESVKLLRVQ